MWRVASVPVRVLVVWVVGVVGFVEKKESRPNHLPAFV